MVHRRFRLYYAGSEYGGTGQYVECGGAGTEAVHGRAYSWRVDD